MFDNHTEAIYLNIDLAGNSGGALHVALESNVYAASDEYDFLTKKFSIL